MSCGEVHPSAVSKVKFLFNLNKQEAIPADMGIECVLNEDGSWPENFKPGTVYRVRMDFFQASPTPFGIDNPRFSIDRFATVVDPNEEELQ